jgi:hypothetical protein
MLALADNYNALAATFISANELHLNLQSGNKGTHSMEVKK